MNPEQQAREKIDAALQGCGWTVKDHKSLDLSTGRGIALCEVFSRGNDFAKKITAPEHERRNQQSGQRRRVDSAVSQLAIAVTVDMIATGTDIKLLECLLFLRDVRSRVYSQQIKGRGTRVLTSTHLQAVSGATADAKAHFVDAVGVCESDKSIRARLIDYPL